MVTPQTSTAATDAATLTATAEQKKKRAPKGSKVRMPRTWADAPPLLSVAMAAHLCAVSPGTIARWIAEKRLRKVYRTHLGGGGCNRIDRDELAALLGLEARA